MSRRHDMHYSLLRFLGRNGWRRCRVEHPPGGGPVTEVWEVESLCASQSVRAYLVFQTRPEIYGSRVHVQGQRRERWNLPWWEGTYLGRRWRDGFPAIFAALTRWRNRRVNQPAFAPAAGAAGDPAVTQAASLCAELENRLRFLRVQLTDRKWRLFVCACLRRFPHVIADERNMNAVEAEERYADGLTPKRELKKARKAARLSWLPSYEPFDEASAVVRAAAVQVTPERQRSLLSVLEDQTGHLWHPVPLRPSWLRRNGGIVAAMTRAIYTDHSFADLPILADALEEAGCDNVDILDHCRRPGEHARGCWVLDLLLGKQ